ncbi:MAG: right-handed parallel beta-helix repeat-containing protein [Planctomycetaceae bacterium]
MSRDVRMFVRWSAIVFLLIVVASVCGIWLESPNAAAEPLFPAQSPDQTPRPAGDGVTDVTDLLQAQIDAGREQIHLARGRYRITKPIVVNLDEVGPTSISGDGTATIVMDGPGPAIRFVGTHDGTASPTTFRDNVWLNQRTPMVDGIEIVGNHPDACGIEADGTMQLTVTRTVIRKSLHGIHLVNRNRNVIISECHIYENRGAGVFYDSVSLHQSNIVGCHISYNQQGGVVVKGGDVRNIQIGTCDIEGNMGSPDAAPSANVWLDSTGGSIAEVAIVGCTIQHAHEASDSANIRFNGLSNPVSFTDETRHGFVTIADNVLSDVQVNVEVTNARGVTITGNTCWKGYSQNLKVANSANIVVANNVFERNPRYHYGDGSTAMNALLFENCNGCTFSGNQIQGATGRNAAVEIRNCRRFNVTNCSILDCSPRGLLLEDVSQSRVSDCLILSDSDSHDAAAALQVSGGGGNQIVDNVVGSGNP